LLKRKNPIFKNKLILLYLDKAEASDGGDDILQTRKPPPESRKNFGKPSAPKAADPINGLLEGLVILRVEDFLPPGYRPGAHPPANEETGGESDGYYEEDRSLNEILQEKYKKSDSRQVGS
jgi:hypothetical protein